MQNATSYKCQKIKNGADTDMLQKEKNNRWDTKMLDWWKYTDGFTVL